MADVKLSGIGIVDINGSVGSRTFARNAFGIYVKNRIGAPTGTGAYLVAWQSLVAGIIVQWQNATDADRRPWYKASLPSKDAFGNRNKVSGYQLYMKVNMIRAALSTGYTLNVPVFNVPVQFSNPAFINTNAGTMTGQFDSSGNTTLVWYATPPLSSGRMSYNQIYYNMLIDAVGAGTRTLDFTASYIARFGAPPVGSKVFIRVDPLTTFGIRGRPVYMSAVIT